MYDTFSSGYSFLFGLTDEKCRTCVCSLNRYAKETEAVDKKQNLTDWFERHGLVEEFKWYSKWTQSK